jgi:hypothetical protein
MTKTRIKYESRTEAGLFIESYTPQYGSMGAFIVNTDWYDLEDRLQYSTRVELISKHGVNTLEYAKAVIDRYLAREAEKKAVKASKVTKYIGYP